MRKLKKKRETLMSRPLSIQRRKNEEATTETSAHKDIHNQSRSEMQRPVRKEKEEAKEQQRNFEVIIERNIGKLPFRSFPLLLLL